MKKNTENKKILGALSVEDVKFDEKGLVTAVAQDVVTGKVLMQAFMNKEALETTLKTRQAHYYSRSRKKLWRKGEESGHTQEVKQILLDCDADCVLMLVQQTGAACHTNNPTCFFTEFNDFQSEDIFDAEDYGFNTNGAEILCEIYETVRQRAENPEEGSYTNYLLDKGLDKICKKVAEEAAETIIAAKNSDPQELSGEIADLFYHIAVLCHSSNIDIKDVFKTLKERHSKPRKEIYTEKGKKK